MKTKQATFNQKQSQEAVTLNAVKDENPLHTQLMSNLAVAESGQQALEKVRNSVQDLAVDLQVRMVKDKTWGEQAQGDGSCFGHWLLEMKAMAHKTPSILLEELRGQRQAIGNGCLEETVQHPHPTNPQSPGLCLLFPQAQLPVLEG